MTNQKAVSTEIRTEVDMTRTAETLKRIKARRRHLQKVAKDLKGAFVGIDPIIDEIIRNIEVWYVMPEVITRPVIVNLWGMTGVGKTDLVRRLVRGLKFNDKFLEIQLCNSGSATNAYGGTLSGQLSCSNLDTKQPGILLLDEIQRFRTINEDGKEITDYKFQDVWMMLSDGKFSGSTDKEDIMRVMFEHVYWSIPDEKKNEEQTAEQKQEEKKKKYRQSYYSAKFLRKALRLSEPVEEIMQWDNDKKMKVALERMDDQSTYEGDDFSKVLVFISGNLDEAYKMSGDCSDTNHEADILHAFSKKINIITIKNALMKRFKPEQISRLGNTHIIYPSLSRKSYETIIQRRIGSVLDGIKKEHGISISVDQEIYDFIYRNGVYPSQGVRPLFSTIASYIENLMPVIVLGAIENQIDSVSVTYKDKKLVAKAANLPESKFSLSVNCQGVIDTIKSNNDAEGRVQISVHEAAHAVAYAVLFGIAPTQIISNVASDNTGGFIGIHGIKHNHRTVRDLSTVMLAGACGEEIVFGEDSVSNGAMGDIGSMTTMLAQAVKEWGLFGINTRIEAEGWGLAKYSNNNNDRLLNDLIEKVANEQRDAARILLKRHIRLLQDVSDYLIKHGKMIDTDFVALCARHGVVCRIVDPKVTVYDTYTDKYKAFFKTLS